MNHLVSRVLWNRARGYILWNVHIPVMCVKYILDILGSIHIPVMCAIKHSITQVASRYIKEYIRGSVLITVMCVVKHSGNDII
jgi:hypothetical protein